MQEAVELANQQIYAYAREHPEVRGMGTTVTAAGIFGDELYLAQIGDSRAYLVRNGEAIQLTKDQSLMQRLVDAGELTEEEAEQSERRNIILQALGPDPRVKVDLTHQTTPAGRHAHPLLRRPVRPGEAGGVRADGGGERRPALALQRADRSRQRARRAGQHHRGGGAIRGRRACPSRTPADGAGYQVYNVPDEEISEPAPARGALAAGPASTHRGRRIQPSRRAVRAAC